MSALHYPAYGEPLAQHEMRMRLRGVTPDPRPSSAEAWQKLSLPVRQRFAQEALGVRGLQVYELAWSDIAVQDRVRIGAAVRAIAAALVA